MPKSNSNNENGDDKSKSKDGIEPSDSGEGEEERKNQDIIPKSVLDKIPEEIRTEVIRSIATYRRFQGPMPPPDLYGEYEKVHPGSAEMIVTGAGESGLPPKRN